MRSVQLLTLARQALDVRARQAAANSTDAEINAVLCAGERGAGKRKL